MSAKVIREFVNHKLMADKNKCSTCGCTCAPQQKQEKEAERTYHEETHFAVLLALVPAMTMSLFNLMGLV